VSAVRLQRPAEIPEQDLVEWGPAGEPLSEPPSLTRGRLLHRDADGGNETGVWVCTPGRWRCVVERAEFCQFLAGRCVYTADSGERLEIGDGDAAFFPAGWSGTCEVLETVRKTYMIP
jgi:uncharacterized cupin superfamily protein